VTALKSGTALCSHEHPFFGSGLHKNAGLFQIVAMEEEAQANIVHHQ
jgi:hypothetical protein